MTKIVISGYYGFANAGDEAMLSALVTSLREYISDAEITVISGNPAMTGANHQVRTVHRFNLPGIVAAVRSCQILISGGGSLLQDVTSARSIYYYLFIIRLAEFFGKPVMLYAQGIGPVTRPRARKAVRSVLQKVQMIGVRDADSQTELEVMGVTAPPIYVTADAVLSMRPADREIGAAILQSRNLKDRRKKIGIAVRDWQGLTAYKKALAESADALYRLYEGQIVFIPMQHPADSATAKEIMSYMECPAVSLESAYSAAELMSLLGAMDVVIANRLHALVFASLMGVPVTAISYDPKIDSFINLIGEKICGTVDTIRAEAIVADAAAKLAAGAQRREVKEKLDALRRRSLQNADLAVQALHRKG